jgi:hypothetical protein
MSEHFIEICEYDKVHHQSELPTSRKQVRRVKCDMVEKHSPFHLGPPELQEKFKMKTREGLESFITISTLVGLSQLDACDLIIRLLNVIRAEMLEEGAADFHRPKGDEDARPV